jgi:hypothetical protein
MFEISKLKRQIERIRRSYAEQREELKKKNAPQNQLDQLEAAADFAVQENEHEIDWIVSTRLSHEARSLDVETPPLSNKEMWEHDAGGLRVWLTSKGRAHVRNLIHEESKRRFEDKSRWIPLLSIVLAIIGTITSLVALTVQRKSAEAAATAAGTARISAELARDALELNRKMFHATQAAGFDCRISPNIGTQMTIQISCSNRGKSSASNVTGEIVFYSKRARENCSAG